MRAESCIVAVAVAWASFSSRVEAQSRPIAEAITVVTDDACLRDEALLESLATWSHRDAIDARVSLLLESAEGRGTLSVLVEGEVRAARRFDRLPSSCADRRAVLGLAAAIALDAALVDALVPIAPVEPTTTPPPAIAAAPASSPTAGAPSSAGVEVVTTLAGGLAVGQLPMASPAVSLDVGIVVERAFAVVLGARASGPSTSPIAAGALEAALVAGHVHACLIRGDASLELGGCLGVSAGALLARGRDFPDPRAIALPRLAASARLEGTWWLDSGVGLVLVAEAQAAFPEVELEVLGPSGQVVGREVLPPAAFVIGLGARFRTSP